MLWFWLCQRQKVFLAPTAAGGTCKMHHFVILIQQRWLFMAKPFEVVSISGYQNIWCLPCIVWSSAVSIIGGGSTQGGISNFAWFQAQGFITLTCCESKQSFNLMKAPPGGSGTTTRKEGTTRKRLWVDLNKPSFMTIKNGFCVL